MIMKVDNYSKNILTNYPQQKDIPVKKEFIASKNLSPDRFVSNSLSFKSAKTISFLSAIKKIFNSNKSMNSQAVKSEFEQLCDSAAVLNNAGQRMKFWLDEAEKLKQEGKLQEINRYYEKAIREYVCFPTKNKPENNYQRPVVLKALKGYIEFHTDKNNVKPERVQEIIKDLETTDNHQP